MTLIMPPGEDIMVSPKDGDADSGCFAESCEDGKDGGCNLKEGGCLTPDLKRQQDVQDHMSTPSPDLGPRHNSSSYGDDDHPGPLFDPDDTDSSPDGTLDKTPPSDRSPTNSLVIYNCKTSLKSENTPSESSQPHGSHTEASPPAASPHGVVATKHPSDCGGGTGATQEPVAAAASPAQDPLPSTPTPHIHEEPATPTDPVATKDITEDYTNAGNFTQHNTQALAKEILSEPDTRPRSLNLPDASDIVEGVPVFSKQFSKSISETRNNRSSSEIIKSDTNKTHLNNKTRDSDSKRVSVSEQSVKCDYGDSNIQSKHEVHTSNINQNSPVENIELQAAKQKIVTMRQNFLFSLATSEVCDIQKPQVVKCVSVGGTEREDVSDRTQVPDILRAQEGGSGVGDELREVLGVQQGAWQHHVATPSSDSNRKSSLENWTRELQARKGPQLLTDVHQRENIARSEAGSRRASEYSEGPEVGIGGQHTNAATGPLHIGKCSVISRQAMDRGSCNLSGLRCDIVDQGGEQHLQQRPRDDAGNCGPHATSSHISHAVQEVVETTSYCARAQVKALRNSRIEHASGVIHEHPHQLVSSARDHDYGDRVNTCVSDITSEPSRLTPAHQSPAVVLHRARNYEQQERTGDHYLSNNQRVNVPILPDISSYSQELYQRPPPPQFSSTTSEGTSNPLHRSIAEPSVDFSNKVSLSSPRDPQNKCGLVIALTGDTVGVDVRIVKNKDAKLVKLQDERPRKYIESQIDMSNNLTENKTKSNDCINRPYIKDLDRGKLSSYENYIESEESESEPSCVNLLNFDRNGESDSDVEYNEQRKRRLSEACKDIARAFDALPTPQEENTLNSPLKIYKVPINFREKIPRKHKDQEIEACHSDSSELEELIKQKRTRAHSLHTSTSVKDGKRNSFYDNYCTEDSSCECRQCHTSADEEESDIFKIPTHLKSDNVASDKKYINSRDTSDCDDGFRTDVGDGCRTDEFDPVSSEDNDYDDDYCQTDDCGDDCDYCSGEDAEDEEDKADMTCYYCRNAPSMIAGCKHPGVITNGILKSYGRYDRSGAKHRVVRQRPLILQAAIQRRRLSRRGLVAIRESSLTSDENISEEESYDGSNCDISSSWKFGLHHDISSSRSSTLKSEKSRSSTLKSEKSSSSAPMERARITAKEKSNSLPVDMTRSMSGVEAMRQHADSKLLRYPSTSEEESGSVSSLGPRLPPRPPRAPNVRSGPSPSPPSSLELSHSPRPRMGLQGLQQRSPSTPSPKTLHSSGLPVVPRTQVAPRSPSNPNPPYGFPLVNGNAPLCPSSPILPSRSTPSPVEVLNTSTTEGGKKSSSSPRVSSRAGALVTRNFSISDDESSGKWTGGRRHVTITRHESVYKEVAEHGYVLPPGSPVDPYWLTWKLGVLQKTVEDVSGHLEEAEKTVATWGAIPQDPNLADQHVHNVRKFREGLADLQRGVDDVNDQAARFSAHNVPLTPSNSAKLQDLNNRWKTLETAVNDRWRQVAGKSREVTPFTPAQLASSVSPPWERATTSNKVPYYINHEQESTRWDHPLMLEMLDELTEFNHIKFSAYRTATKLRVLQKKLALDHANMLMATDLFDEHGLRGQNDRLIDVNDMMVVLSALYSNISADHPEINIAVAMDLCLNWLLNVYDSQRTGQMRVLSFKIGLICLCQGHLDEKYRYMFRLIADPNHMVDQRKMGLLLHDCVQVPRQLGEVAAFGGSNIEPSVRSCFTKAGKDRETVEAMHFLSWVQQEPQSLVWLAVLHRVAASENIIHQVKCNICRTCPIVGLRYRCLKCLSFDMCQQCFFEGRSGKSHKVTHPMHEYCTATTAGEDVKDFTKALKNKFKSKRSLQKQAKKGYLPVQSVLEGDALESPSPSPQYNVNSQDMHSRLEAYASRLAEVELKTNSNSTPDSEDEHGLIAQYCQSLSSSDAPIPVPRSPLQIMAAVDADQKDELEQMIRDLEDENQTLQAEYENLRSQQPIDFPQDDLSFERSETEMLVEAKLLRQHKGRLEARMVVLEEHNTQLEAQLHRLRKILKETSNLPSPNASGTLETKSVTASQLAMDSPTRINGYSSQDDMNDHDLGSTLHCPYENRDEDNDEDDVILGKEEITNLNNIQ